MPCSSKSNPLISSSLLTLKPTVDFITLNNIPEVINVHAATARIPTSCIPTNLKPPP